MLSDPEEDYRLGSVPFLGVEIRLDSHPLIPRTETEYWTELAIAEMLDVGHQAFRVLDMFAGSGAVGLAVLKHVPRAEVVFAEKEARHFPTIKRSIRENNLDASRAAFAHADVWTLTGDVGRPLLGEFDYVFANPPYLSKKRASASPETLAHEPHEALFAPDDGFALIRRFIEGLPGHLAKSGTAWVEHEPFHAARIKKAAARQGLAAATHPDQYGKGRFTALTFSVSTSSHH